MATTLLNPLWISLICQECGEPFAAIDADRKWCDAHLVERVNGAGILEDDDDDNLFTERTLVCQGCGATFTTTNPRQGMRCALCNAGLMVKVICPACDIEHQIPILKPHKLCLSCSADMTMTLASARVRLERACEEALVVSVRLDADVAHADAATQARFEAAVQMLFTGQLAGRQLTIEQVRAAWSKACAKGDDLSALLALYDRAQAAALAQQRAEAAVQAVEEAVEYAA